MAIFHLSVRRIGGNSGRSSVGAAAYRSGEKLRNEYDGITHDYSYRRGAVGTAAYHSGERLRDGDIVHDFTQKGEEIVHNEIILPENAPLKFLDRATLWNSVETAKKQHNEQTSRMIVVALPNELTMEQNIKLVQYYVQKNFVDGGMCADFSIHAGHIHAHKNKEYPFQDLAIQKENPHAHIQLTTRPLNEDGTWANKTKKEYILDKNGNRIRTESGKDWRSRNVQLTDWEKPETLIKWRESWAVTVNRTFERLGIDERIDHRSLEEQGIDRKPTVHMGHKAWNLEKKGIKTKVGDMNRAIMTHNKARQQEVAPEVTADFIHELKERYVTIFAEISTINDEISVIEREKFTTQTKAEEIEGRVKEIQARKERIAELKAQRQKMGFYKSKKEIDELIQSNERTHNQAEKYFMREFKISPEQAPAEIQRLKVREVELGQKIEPLRSELPPLIVNKETLKFEYQKQKILADISRDRERIYRRLERLESEILKNKLSPKDELIRMQCERILDTITERELQKIVKELRPEQKNAVIERRAQEKEKAKELEKGIDFKL